MKVKLLRDARVLVPAGSQIEMAEEGARQLVSLGSAVEIKNKVERQTPEAPEEEIKPKKETKKG